MVSLLFWLLDDVYLFHYTHNYFLITSLLIVNIPDGFLQTYMMNAVHVRLFCVITAAVAAEDAEINKMTRNLASLQLQDMGIRKIFRFLKSSDVSWFLTVGDCFFMVFYTKWSVMFTCLKSEQLLILQYKRFKHILLCVGLKVAFEVWWYNFTWAVVICYLLLQAVCSVLVLHDDFSRNIPAAKKELATLNRFSTPLGRLFCMKRVVTALTRPLKHCGKTDRKLFVSDQDFCPLQKQKL